MNSAFWWKLRHWWHTPSSRQQGYKPATFIDSWEYEGKTEYYLNPQYHLNWNLGKYKNIGRVFIRDLKALWFRIFWAFMWLQPFRCNGNYGGWRTEFCEWLENKAREHEDIEDV